MSTPYPFTAIVGQDDLRLGLLLNAVSPAVGGVLVRVRGTPSPPPCGASPR
ncbi:magnesium chelatase subunit D [Streptomyces sp. Ncost-T6T-2b]|nr:magnesium chelatase subunit D [Streptomyces sp. Ncost-T6T-2b]